MTLSLSDAIRELAKARAELQAARDARAAWLERHPELAELAAAIETATWSERNSRAVVETLALDEYGATGEKKPHPAVKIVISQKVQYEPAEALEWARSEAPMLLVTDIDRKAFEKLALNMPTVPPCAQLVAEPQVRVSSDLSLELEPAP